MITQPVPRPPAEPETSVSVLELAAILLRQWKVVALSVAVALALGLVLALLLPRPYVARTVLVPAAEQGSSPAQLLAQLPEGLAPFAPAGNSKQQLIETILGSRSLADRMVEQLAAGESPVEEARVWEALSGVEAKSNPADGSLTISVESDDAPLAARVANEFPPLINEIAARLGAQFALRRREYLESQVAEAAEQLERSEERLLEFQRSRDAPEFQEQARQTIEAAADLQQAVIEKEVEVAQLRRVLTPENPQLRAAVAELEARRGQLRRLTSPSQRQDNIFIPLGESPQLKVEATRLLREYNKNERVYISLMAALADAQAQVEDDLPVVAVLDAALVPTAPESGHVALALAVAGFLGLLVGLVAAFVRESLQRLRRQPAAGPFFLAWEQFKSDLRMGPRGGRSSQKHLSPGD